MKFGPTGKRIKKKLGHEPNSTITITGSVKIPSLKDQIRFLKDPTGLKKKRCKLCGAMAYGVTKAGCDECAYLNPKALGWE